MTRLQQLRLDRLLSVEEVSDATGVPVRTLYRIEAGEIRLPRIDTLRKLSTFFAVPASSLLRDVPSAPDPTEPTEQAA